MKRNCLRHGGFVYLTHCSETQHLLRGGPTSLTDGTNRRPICDFLLVINTNLHPILYRFQLSYCRLLVKFALSIGVPVFNTFVRGEPLKGGPQILAFKKLEDPSIVRC